MCDLTLLPAVQTHSCICQQLPESDTGPSHLVATRGGGSQDTVSHGQVMETSACWLRAPRLAQYLGCWCEVALLSPLSAVSPDSPPGPFPMTLSMTRNKCLMPEKEPSLHVFVSLKDADEEAPWWLAA